MAIVRTMACLMMIAGLAIAAPVPPPPKPVDGELPLSAAKLLKHRKVQKEMKLTAEQRIALVDGVADIEEAFDKKRTIILNQRNGPPNNNLEKLETEHLETLEKFLKASAAKVLTVQNRTRLAQIDRQVRGTSALLDPDVEKLLKLSDKQKKAVEDTAKALEAKADDYISKLGNDDSDNAKEDLLKLRKESLQSLTGKFTEDQRIAWKSLLGEPVKGFDATELWFTILEDNDDLPMP